MDDVRKQDAGKSGSETTREGFSAGEIGEQSAYDDATDAAQQMRRGDAEHKETADDRDGVGKADIAEWDQRQVREDKVKE